MFDSCSQTLSSEIFNTVPLKQVWLFVKNRKLLIYLNKFQISKESKIPNSKTEINEIID